MTQGLEGEQERALDAALASLEGVHGAPSVTRLLERWQQCGRQLKNGYPLTGYDYLDLLDVRSLLGRLEMAIAPELRVALLNLGLESGDVLFRRGTEACETVIGGETLGTDEWWRLRMPIDRSEQFETDLRL